MMNTLFALILGAVLAAPAAPATALPAAALDNWQQESYLLNQQVDFSDLERWDRKERQWRRTTPDGGRIVILHLWADWCPPCVAELPELRRLAQQLNESYPGEVSFQFVAAKVAPEALQAFMKKNPNALPSKDRDKDAALYHDGNGRIVDDLSQGLPATSLTLPATLVLDRDRVVRHALVGPMLQRRGELVSSVTRLVQLSRSLAARPRSPDAAPR